MKLPDPHPSTGVRVVVCIPTSPVFSEVTGAYRRLAKSRPWLEIVAEDDFASLRDEDLLRADDLFVLSWSLIVPGRPSDRGAKIGVVYSEAVGDAAALLPEHRADLTKLEALAGGYDCILGHTPWMADTLARFGTPTAVLPLGWDPSMGVPDFRREKTLPAVYYGSMVGKRLWSASGLKEALGAGAGLFHDRTGWFGQRLTYELNHAQTVLYLAHSDVDSFSTWRAWQASATSAVLLAEPGDAWPFERGRHIQSLPQLTPGSLAEAALVVRQAIEDYAGSMDMARRAHDEVARKWTTEWIVDELLVDVAAKICAGQNPRREDVR